MAVQSKTDFNGSQWRITASNNIRVKKFKSDTA